MRHREGPIASMVSFPIMHNFNEKALDKPNLRHSQQNWPVPFKSVKVIKDKGSGTDTDWRSLRNHEKTLESPLDCKEIQPVHSKGDQPWDFFGRNDAEAETPVLWPPHVKSWLIGKVSDAGRDWGQEEKGTAEDEMAGWYHRLDGHESGWTPGVGDGQGGLACCDSWGHKESDTTERLNWTELKEPWQLNAESDPGTTKWQ